MIKVLTIEEIKGRMQAMRKHKKRGFPMSEFARFAGVDYRQLKRMFFEQTVPITELSQRKISKALLALESGEAGLRMNLIGERILDFHPRKEQKPAFKKGMSLNLGADGPRLNIGPVNRYSFNTNTFFNKRG